MKTVNSIMKRILTTGLAVVLLAGSAPANVYAEGLTDPETPLIISGGVEEDGVSSSVETTGSEVLGTEALDEPGGQTIDDPETEAVSDEGAVSADSEDETGDEEPVPEDTDLIEFDAEEALYDEALTVENVGSPGAEANLVYTADRSIREDAESYLSYTADGASDGFWGDSPYQYLLDNDKDTKWGTGFNGTKYVEFHSAEPITPVAYVLTTGDDTDKYPGRNPSSWKVLAKHAADDAEWTVLHEVNNDTILQGESGKDYTYEIDNSQFWQYFRYEVSAIKGGDGLQVADFKFLVFWDPKDLGNVTVTGIKTSYTYTGETIDIDYVLTARDGTQLVKGTDYTETISPDPVKEPGRYTITLTGKGDYHGQKTVPFRISSDRPSLQGVKNGDMIYFPWKGVYSDNVDFLWRVLSTEGDHTLPVSGDDQALLIWNRATGERYGYQAAEKYLTDQYQDDSWKIDNIYITEHDAIDNTSVVETEGYGDFLPASFDNKHFFSLSAHEAANLFKNNDDRNITTNADGYWLRSKKTDREIAYVNTSGEIALQNTNSFNYGHSVRPAFNLDLDRILYASPAVGYDRTTTPNQIIHIPENTTNNWKLTYISSRSDGVEVANSTMLGVAGNALHLSYSRSWIRSDVNDVIQIAGLLYDKEGKLIGYGRSGSISADFGTVDFTLPDDLEAGYYTLLVFNEFYELNGYYWNYASPPCEVGLTVLDKNSIVMPEAIDGLAYTGEPQELITAGQTGDLTLLYAVTARGAVKPDDNLYNTAIPTATDAGEYDVWVKAQGYDDVFACVNAKIERRDYTGVKSVSVIVPSNTATQMLYVQLPALPEGAAYDRYGTIGGDTPALFDMSEYNWRPFVHTGNNLLVREISSQPEGTSATVTVGVTGAKNYKDYNVVVTYTARDKGDAGAAITGGDKTVTYGDADFTLAGTLTDAGTGIGVWTWSSENASVAQIEEGTGKVTIKGAGTANIKAEYVSETTIGEASITLTVKQKPVTITGVTVNDKEYDGTKNATIKSSGIVTGAVEGDEVSAVAGTAWFSDKNVGNKAVSFSGFSLGGADAANYSLASQPEGVTANIKGRTVTVAGISAANRAFNGSNTVELTGGSLSGVIGGDSVSVDASSMTGKMADANAGAGKPVTVTGLKLTGDDVGNYTLTQPTGVTVTIIKAAAPAHDGITRTYPYKVNAKDSVDLSSLVPEDAGTVTYQPPEAIGDISYEEDPAVSGSILSYMLQARDGAEIGFITVTAQMQNYNDVMLIVNIEQIALGLYEKTGKTQYDPRPSKNLNQGKSFTLVPMFADGTVLNKRVVWSSSNPDVATVTQDGKVTGIGGGETVITARSEETPTLSASCHVSVAEPVTGITLNRTGYSFGTGETVILTATVLPFTAIQPLRWESNNANVTIVPSTDGLSATITGAAAGKATVTAYATDDSGKKATCGFTVGSAVPAANEDGFSVTGKGNAENLAAGKTLAMNVNWPGNKKPANAEVIWSVVAVTGETKEASRIATISQKGVLTGLSEGKIKVVATSVANSAIVKESAEITVYVPVKSVALNATSGTVSIKGKDGANGLQLQALVTSAIAGQTATGTALGLTPVVEWKVDPRYAHPEYLTVTPGGEVTANVTNAVNNIPVIGTVRAYNYEKTLTCKVSVKAENPLKGIKISSKKLSAGEGNTANLTATLDPVNPDGDKGYTWSSSDPSVVTVDEKTGTVTALKPGTATITVTAKGKVVSKGKETNPSAACTVTVTPSVTGIVLKNVNATNRLAIGKTLSVKTEFVSSDENKKASTMLVWSSSDESIATVTQKGVIKAVSPGTVTITAQSADVKAVGPAPSKSFEVEVYAPVTKIAIDKSKLTIGTQNGSQYGRVSVSALLPVNVSDPSVEWKTNNELVELAAVDKGLAPSTGNFVNAKSNGVTVGGGQYLAVQAVSPGVVTLTGIAKDGSGKKVTCTVTVRGEVTGLSLKPLPPKNGLGQVEDKGEGKYESNLAPKGKLSLTPVVEINGITEATQKKTFADYKKYTDVSVSYRSSDTGVATVDKNGKITVNKDAQNEATATIYVTTADGRKTVELKITVVK